MQDKYTITGYYAQCCYLAGPEENHTSVREGVCVVLLTALHCEYCRLLRARALRSGPPKFYRHHIATYEIHTPNENYHLPMTEKRGMNPHVKLV